MTSGWPFKGDHTVQRARKMCLAYRAVALQQQQMLQETRTLLAKIDRRLLNFGDAELDQRITDHLLKTPPDLVGDLDRRFTEWGQTWHAEVTLEYGPDDVVPAKVAASLINIALGSLGTLRRRGRIKGEFRGRLNGYYYKVSDVYALSSELRPRKNGTPVPKTQQTDTVTDSRRSATK